MLFHSDHIQGPPETWKHLGVSCFGPRVHTLLLCVSTCVCNNLELTVCEECVSGMYDFP